MDRKTFYSESSKALRHIDEVLGELEHENLDVELAGDVLTLAFTSGETSSRPGDRAETSSRPGDRAETSSRPGDRAETSSRPGDRAENSSRPGDRAETSSRPGDRAEKFIINAHSAAKQIWMAAGTTAWHFDFVAERSSWIAHKTGDELMATVARVVGDKLGQPVSLS